jgi:predicted ATP-dependent protease
MYRRAIAIIETSYGPDHPNVATCLNNLAGLLQATNRLSEAERMLRRGLVILVRFTQTAGYQHPDLLKYVAVYARTLRELGRTDAAIQDALNAIWEEVDSEP